MNDHHLPNTHEGLTLRSWQWIREGIRRCREHPADRQRRQRIEREPVSGVAIIVPHYSDLAVSKLIAGREKDMEFASGASWRDLTCLRRKSRRCCVSIMRNARRNRPSRYGISAASTHPPRHHKRHVILLNLLAPCQRRIHDGVAHGFGVLIGVRGDHFQKSRHVE